MAPGRGHLDSPGWSGTAESSGWCRGPTPGSLQTTEHGSSWSPSLQPPRRQDTAAPGLVAGGKSNAVTAPSNCVGRNRPPSPKEGNRGSRGVQGPAQGGGHRRPFHDAPAPFRVRAHASGNAGDGCRGTPGAPGPPSCLPVTLGLGSPSQARTHPFPVPHWAPGSSWLQTEGTKNPQAPWDRRPNPSSHPKGVRSQRPTRGRDPGSHPPGARGPPGDTGTAAPRLPRRSLSLCIFTREKRTRLRSGIRRTGLRAHTARFTAEE